MTSISLPARAEYHPNLRPLNVLRDLSQVADLVESCFAQYRDPDGEEYVRQMRRASRDESWLRWASSTMEGASMPLTGYVWEENGRIVGNTSLIVFRHHGKKIYMIANVAVHPEARHRGIARAVVERAAQHARERKADELWLHVRDDNPDALGLYADLGFREHARRTTWFSTGDPFSIPIPTAFQIQPRPAGAWPRHSEWIERLHPDELGWYRNWNFKVLAPGLWNWLYLLFVDINLRQWAAFRADTSTLRQAQGNASLSASLEAVLSWTPNGSRYDEFWLALGADSAPQAATSLLVHARRELGPRKFVLDHPVGPADEAIRAAGFLPHRTLLWMRADAATK